ncbi:hypothetical protein [Nesterenkonia sp. NBAIMH1]|uniref:hypothetical protein n=1 Tax=Nesterenkonia sp. NBAIMH1 TaxID=2600320 RepID=UPI0011B5952A|nr:hypothetical protein [Nesterenkonia sp. NBAIMH1]
MSSEEHPTQELPGAARLETRLQAMLLAPSSEQPEAETARGWLDLAYEAAYGERHAAAVEAGLRGLRAPGGDDPEYRLPLLRLLAGVHEMRGDSESGEPYQRERTDLMRRLGRTRQAQIESELGGMLLREPDRVEGEILARVAEQLEGEAAEAPADEAPWVLTARADVLSSLAVRRLQDEGPQAALPLVEEVVAILEALTEDASDLHRSQALAGARMFLAHAQLLCEDPEAAAQTAAKVLSSPANRAVRGAMAMLRATIHHQADEVQEAVERAIQSAELYAACGVRRGAASAAALLAGITSGIGRPRLAVLAWRAAVQQAELGEFEDSRILSLALGQQLLEMDEHEEAELILDSLSLRLTTGEEDHSTRGRALMGLGHAVTQQKRPLEAMSHWAEAAGQFLAAEETDEAARAHLAAGALAASLDRVEAAQEHYERGLQLADQGADTDPLMLLQALHSLGHLLCRHEDADGLTHLSRALRIAAEHGTQWQQADIVDTRARSLTALGRGSEAVAAALEAADLFISAGDEEAGADAELFAAAVLRQIGQSAEAETLFRMTMTQRTLSDQLMEIALEGQVEALRDMARFDDAHEAERSLEALRERLSRAEEG